MKNSLYTVIKNHINRGNYQLNEVVYKINEARWDGHITDDECTTLITMAHDNAKPDNEMPEIMSIVKELSGKVETLSVELNELTQKVNGILNPEPEQPVDPDVPVVPEDPKPIFEYYIWERWNGMSNNYQLDAIVQHGDKFYRSTYNGQNVWEPGTLGIDERYWIEYIPEAGAIGKCLNADETWTADAPDENIEEAETEAE